MTSRARVTLGFVVGIAVGAVILVVVFRALQHAHPGANVAPEQRAQAVQPGSAGLVSPASSGDVRTQSVTVYGRAETDDVRFAGVPAEITWLSAPSDRALEIVQLVLDGVPDAKMTTAAGRGIRCRNVLVTNGGTAWVDLDGGTLGGVQGSDEELSLVGALARSLTDAMPEVRRVGILVDGHPRTTLAGHVDLARTYTGREWPATGGPAQPAAAQDAQSASRTTDDAPAEKQDSEQPSAAPDAEGDRS